MAGTVKIPGIEQTFGDRVLVIPPLSLGSLSALQKRLEALQTETNPLAQASIDTVIDAAHSALKRNYPGMSREEVADMIDVGNMHEITAAVLDVAGLVRKEREAGKRAEATMPAAPPPEIPSTDSPT